MNESRPIPAASLPGADSPGLPRATLRTIRLGRATPRARAAERRLRLADLVDFARRRSAFYERRFRGLPEGVDDVRLPPITKEEAMGAFDDWVTDGRVDRARIEAFLRDPDRIGELFLGRYLAMRTSGSTGGQDARAVGVQCLHLLVEGIEDRDGPVTGPPITRRRSSAHWTS